MPSNCNFSTLFENIDGKQSNCDNFSLHIENLKHKFSVIGLAETNTNPQNKDLFKLNKYSSLYQEIDATKSKGTGVALYIHNSLTATVDQSLSQCTQNLESLFVKFNTGAEEHTVGVIYAPPSGDKSKFISELETIIKSCIHRNLHIFGDFNINLHKIESKTAKKYEDIVLTNGLFPLISISTNPKPGCTPSCRDNSFQAIYITAVPNIMSTISIKCFMGSIECRVELMLKK